MHYLEFYYKTVIQYDLINKFHYNNINELPKLKKIILNFKTKNVKIKTFATTLLAIEIITKKKNTMTTSKKPNIFLKIQKGQPVGGKVILTKTAMYNFLTLFILEIFPSIHNSIKFKQSNKSSFFIKLTNKNLTFYNLKEHYNLYSLIPYITITVVTNSKTHKELFFLLKSFQFNIQQQK